MTSQTDVGSENASSLNAYVVVGACFAIVWCIGAVGINVAHHTPVGVDVADPPETAIASSLTIIVRGAGGDTFVVFTCVLSFAVIIDMAHHAHAGVGVAEFPRVSASASGAVIV